MGCVGEVSLLRTESRTYRGSPNTTEPLAPMNCSYLGVGEFNRDEIALDVLDCNGCGGGLAERVADNFLTQQAHSVGFAFASAWSFPYLAAR